MCLCVFFLQVKYELVNLTSSVLCDAKGLKPRFLDGKAVAVMRGECPFSQKAQMAQDFGAAVLLITIKDAMVGVCFKVRVWQKFPLTLKLTDQPGHVWCLKLAKSNDVSTVDCVSMQVFTPSFFPKISDVFRFPHLSYFKSF